MAYDSKAIHSGEVSGNYSTKDAQELATVLKDIDTAIAAVGAITDLTDNSGGTGTDTIAAIGATYDQDEVRNAVASLADKINEIIVALSATP